MPSAAPRVHFATNAMSSRLPRDDEVWVMKQFASHASHCSTCSRPYDTYTSGNHLCNRGQAYAKDVSQYIYCKGGKAYSTVDRSGTTRVQIEVPRECEVIRDLLRAVDKGMRLPKNKPVVFYDAAAPVSPSHSYDEFDDYNRYDHRRQTSYRDDLVEVVERTPARRESTRTSPPAQRHSEEKVYIKGRGSLYKKDEAARRRRDQGLEEPIIIRASPGVRIREIRHIR